mmetsp:Transcript_29604/g.94792  ORF Transcript_29604/g.94792 Transcript_29604/m.94792 type:complete len:93 (-) Transcript_29604:101-379(-)
MNTSSERDGFLETLGKLLRRIDLKSRKVTLIEEIASRADNGKHASVWRQQFASTRAYIFSCVAKILFFSIICSFEDNHINSVHITCKKRSEA